eukprot:2418494-Rhodomonas_salina.1
MGGGGDLAAMMAARKKAMDEQDDDVTVMKFDFQVAPCSGLPRWREVEREGVGRASGFASPFEVVAPFR